MGITGDNCRLIYYYHPSAFDINRKTLLELRIITYFVGALVLACEWLHDQHSIFQEDKFHFVTKAQSNLVSNVFGNGDLPIAVNHVKRPTITLTRVYITITSLLACHIASRPTPSNYLIKEFNASIFSTPR
jgi:hypothetical protein